MTLLFEGEEREVERWGPFQKERRKKRKEKYILELE